MRHDAIAVSRFVHVKGEFNPNTGREDADFYSGIIVLPKKWLGLITIPGQFVLMKVFVCDRYVMKSEKIGTFALTAIVAAAKRAEADLEKYCDHGQGMRMVMLRNQALGNRTEWVRQLPHFTEAQALQPETRKNDTTIDPSIAKHLGSAAPS